MVSELKKTSIENKGGQLKKPQTNSISSNRISNKLFLYLLRTNQIISGREVFRYSRSKKLKASVCSCCTGHTSLGYHCTVTLWYLHSPWPISLVCLLHSATTSCTPLGKYKELTPGISSSSSALHIHFPFCCRHVYYSKLQKISAIAQVQYKTVQELFIRRWQLQYDITDSSSQSSLSLSKDQFNTPKRLVFETNTDVFKKEAPYNISNTHSNGV